MNLSKLSVPLFVVLGGCSAARPADDPMQGFYGNTWNMYSAEGYDALLVNEDHSWSATFHNGIKVSGTWTIEDGKVCFLTSQYPNNTHCESEILGRRVEATWRSVEDGEEHVSALRPGRK